jgi:CO/xanthine dehydrogenase Mo-binding subunit
MFVIHTPTQWPYHVSRSAAAVLGVDTGQIITESTDTGIPMDGRLWYPSLIACQAALASSLTRRNVRLILNREEDFRFSPKRNASVIEIHSALGEKGEILGTRIALTADLGAQAVFAQEIVDQSCLGVLGIAGSGALDLKARAIKTNIPPQGPYGGFGSAQGIYAMERHHSLIADTLGLDPAEWRKDNRYGRKSGIPLELLSPAATGGPSSSGPVPPAAPGGPRSSGPVPLAAPGSPSPNGPTLLKEAPPAEQLLDTTAAMSDYYRKWASYELLRRRRRQDPPPSLPETRRGIGIALGWQGNGPLYTTTNGGEYGVEVTLNMDGSLEIHTSIRAQAGFIQIWSHIAREILGVEDDKVRVISQNTALSFDSGPACLSRNITTISALIEQCCQTIRNQRFRDPLPITVRKTYQPDSPAAGGSGEFSPPAGMILDTGSLRRPGWGAAVVEIEIEPHSYTPSIRGIWLGIDGGKILAEDRARRGLKIAAIQALGWAAREHLTYRSGGIGPAQISGYGIPSPGEIPPIHIDFLWNDTAAPKGIGELPFCCIPAAYIQAVSQAADHPFERIPQKPDHIWDILKARPPEEGPGPVQGADS